MAASRPSPTTTLPWQFAGGVITRVAVDVSGEPHVDLAREAKAMLVRE
jgi:arylsulfatase